MSKIAEKKALEEYPKINHPYNTDVEKEIDAKRAYYRTSYIVGYDDALADIKQYVQTMINTQKKEWGAPNVDLGLYTILGYIVEIEENE